MVLVVTSAGRVLRFEVEERLVEVQLGEVAAEVPAVGRAKMLTCPGLRVATIVTAANASTTLVTEDLGDTLCYWRKAATS